MESESNYERDNNNITIKAIIDDVELKILFEKPDTTVSISENGEITTAGEVLRDAESAVVDHEVDIAYIAIQELATIAAISLASSEYEDLVRMYGASELIPADKLSEAQARAIHIKNNSRFVYARSHRIDDTENANELEYLSMVSDDGSISARLMRATVSDAELEEIYTLTEIPKSYQSDGGINYTAERDVRHAREEVYGKIAELVEHGASVDIELFTDFYAAIVFEKDIAASMRDEIINRYAIYDRAQDAERLLDDLHMRAHNMKQSHKLKLMLGNGTMTVLEIETLGIYLKNMKF